MIVPKPRSSAVVLLACLLAFATSAHAECAWLFWMENESNYGPYLPPSVHWAVPVAFPDRASCVARISSAVKVWERKAIPSQRITASGTVAEIRTPNKDRADIWFVARLHCLPNTVDPRGPKGR